jgi:hypothetical protein
MLLVGSKFVKVSYVNKKLWRNKMWGLLWMSLWKLDSLLMSDLYKGEYLSMCNELFWVVVLM